MLTMGGGSKVVGRGLVGSETMILSTVEDVPKVEEPSLDELRIGTLEVGVGGASNVEVIGVENKVKGTSTVPVKGATKMVEVVIMLVVGVTFANDEIDGNMCEVEIASVLKCEDRLGSMAVAEIIAEDVCSPSVLLGLTDNDVEVVSSTEVELTVGGAELGSGIPLPKGGKAGSVP